MLDQLIGYLCPDFAYSSPVATHTQFLVFQYSLAQTWLTGYLLVYRRVRQGRPIGAKPLSSNLPMGPQYESS